ncbi:MAG: 6-phosphogluconolactonase [Sediminibacterium sp.]
MQLNIFHNEEELIVALANYVVESAKQSIARNKKFSIVLSGGNSPKKLYALLASDLFREKIQWEHVYFFFGDERYVPSTDPESNYGMAKTVLFDPLHIQPSHIFPVDTKLNPQAAAQQYAEQISNYFAAEDWRFELVLLGLGDNAHTASLFPSTPVLLETVASVSSVFLEDKSVYRITMNAPLLNQAHRIAFLVYGESKAIAVQHVLEDAYNADLFPAQLIAPQSGELVWFLDTEAASKLQKKS